MDRTLRSKRDRALLWYAADGKCQRCGGPLGDGWHADHVVPWKVTGRTNVHEMQALCAVCNLEKGVAMLRKHQADFEALMKKVATGQIALPRWVILHVAPGGGKSATPVLALHWLRRAGLIKHLCWVTPNATLRDQAMDAFAADSAMARYLGHHLTLIASDNSHNPLKGHDAYSITAHSLLYGAHTIHLQEFLREPYALFVDELHHYATGEPFQTALQPLAERAVCIIAGTGTLDRNDHKPLPIPYLKDGRPDKTNTSTHYWITYGIRDAMRDRAIIKVDFMWTDAAARWRDEGGTEREVGELGISKEALWTALKTEYAMQLLGGCADHWESYRRQHNPQSKLLVVCCDKNQAREAIKTLRNRGIKAEIATYHEGSEVADAHIRRFREADEPHALVTIYKAYEGMDVPGITHIACLTHIRSKSWIMQMIGRAWRYDPAAGPWQHQRAFVFAPNDRWMLECVEEIEAEQDDAIRSMVDATRSIRVNGEEGQDLTQPDIVPITSAATFSYAAEFGGRSQDPSMTAWCLELQEAHPKLRGLSTLEIEDIVADIRRQAGITTVLRPPVMQRVQPNLRTPDPRTELEREKDALEALISRLGGGDKERIIEINNAIKRLFGERRSLSVAQIQEARQYILINYRRTR